MMGKVYRLLMMYSIGSALVPATLSELLRTRFLNLAVVAPATQPTIDTGKEQHGTDIGLKHCKRGGLPVSRQGKQARQPASIIGIDIYIQELNAGYVSYLMITIQS
jgi:hypothetical protein